MTPNSVIDSKWDLTLAQLPEINTANDIMKSILSSSFECTLNIQPFFSFEIGIASKTIELDLGLNIPLQFNMRFNKSKCAFPYLQCQISIPFNMFYKLHEMSISFYTIWEEKNATHLIKSFVFNPFCIGPNVVETQEEQKPIKTLQYNPTGLVSHCTIIYDDDEKERRIQIVRLARFIGKYLCIRCESDFIFNGEMEEEKDIHSMKMCFI